VVLQSSWNPTPEVDAFTVKLRTFEPTNTGLVLTVILLTVAFENAILGTNVTKTERKEVNNMRTKNEIMRLPL
jgi:hypothetical protein